MLFIHTVRPVYTQRDTNESWNRHWPRSAYDNDPARIFTTAGQFKYPQMHHFLRMVSDMYLEVKCATLGSCPLFKPC